MKYVFGGSFICKVRGLSGGLLPNHGFEQQLGVLVLHVTSAFHLPRLSDAPHTLGSRSSVPTALNHRALHQRPNRMPAPPRSWRLRGRCPLAASPWTETTSTPAARSPAAPATRATRCW